MVFFSWKVGEKREGKFALYTTDGNTLSFGGGIFYLFFRQTLCMDLKEKALYPEKYFP